MNFILSQHVAENKIVLFTKRLSVIPKINREEYRSASVYQNYQDDVFLCEVPVLIKNYFLNKKP